MKREAFLNGLRDVGIVPVVKIQDAGRAADLARALLEGGLPAAEITFRTEAAAEAVRAIAQSVPGILVCAGTVLTVETAKKAVDAGAAGIISPGLNPEVVQWCLRHDVPVLPGCATPTEVEACMRLGLDAVKMFPASVVGGTAMLRALGGPYSKVRFMPTGGIGLDSAADYLAQPNVLAVGGSWIAKESGIAADSFAAVTEAARQASALVKRCRSGAQGA